MLTPLVADNESVVAISYKLALRGKFGIGHVYAFDDFFVFFVGSVFGKDRAGNELYGVAGGGEQLFGVVVEDFGVELPSEGRFVQ
jgi:hypothetical protein